MSGGMGIVVVVVVVVLSRTLLVVSTVGLVVDESFLRVEEFVVTDETEVRGVDKVLVGEVAGGCCVVSCLEQVFKQIRLADDVGATVTLPISPFASSEPAWRA